ncbi:MAG: hypothetical protein HY881_16055 [Deltaproteobacteria bacterium]|nr:hypothetical protein [Deltaproteobacteria bacterium]
MTPDKKDFLKLGALENAVCGIYPALWFLSCLLGDDGEFDGKHDRQGLAYLLGAMAEKLETAYNFEPEAGEVEP